MNPFFARELEPPKLPIVFGDKNTAAVVRLQEHLVVRGYVIWTNPANAPGIDGDFGNGTKSGVEQFAKDHGIPPTVNEAFWTILTAPMRKAASFTPTAEKLTAAVVQVALAHAEAAPREARAMVSGRLMGFDNSGPYVRPYLDPFPTWQAPWCMGFVRHPVKKAAETLKIPCAIPLDGPGILPLYVPSIVASAKRAGRFVDGPSRKPVPPGSIAFMRGVVDGMPSHFHVGILIEDHGDKIITVEGNTDEKGGNNGWLVLKKERYRASFDFGLV